MLDMALYEESVKGMSKYQKAREYFKNKLEGEVFRETITRDSEKTELSHKSGMIKMNFEECLCTRKVWR